METLPDHLTQDFPPPPVPRESLDIDAPWAQLTRPLDRASLVEARANIETIRGFLAGMRLETITDANGTVWNVMARRAGVSEAPVGRQLWRIAIETAPTLSIRLETPGRLYNGIHELTLTDETDSFPISKTGRLCLVVKGLPSEDSFEVKLEFKDGEFEPYTYDESEDSVRLKEYRKSLIEVAGVTNDPDYLSLSETFSYRYTVADADLSARNLLSIDEDSGKAVSVIEFVPM